MNKLDEVRLRRFSLNLKLSSLFIIVYAFWQILKFYMGFFWGIESHSEFFGISEDDYLEMKNYLFAMTIMLFIVYAGLHFYVGIKAYRYAAGKKKYRYLISALILFVLSVFSAYGNFGTDKIDDTVVASFILDFTLSIIVADVIYSTIQLRRLRE